MQIAAKRGAIRNPAATSFGAPLTRPSAPTLDDPARPRGGGLGRPGSRQGGGGTGRINLAAVGCRMLHSWAGGTMNRLTRLMGAMMFGIK